MDRIEIKLPNGWVVRDCGLKLLTKYLAAENTLIFDLYSRAQLREASVRDVVGWADGIATEAMSSNLGVAKWTRLAGSRISLRALKPERELQSSTADNADLLEVYANLHEALQITSPESFAQVFKLLALKRPALFPMIDNVVAELFSNKPFKLDGWPWPAQRSVESIWEAVRRDVDGVAGFLMREFAFMLDEVERENPGQLDALSAWLADRLEELGIVRALRLSKIRVLDSLVWFDWNRIDKKKVIFSGFGWLRHPETRQVYYDGEPTALTHRLVEAWQPAGLTPVLALVEGLIAGAI